MTGRIVIVLLGMIAFVRLQAQESLPNFSIEDLGQNKIRISWRNSFETCVQLSIQRSYDSVNNFRTIFSTPSPQLPQNGFIDINPPSNQIYYRIFYVLAGGNYFFTKVRHVGQQGFESSTLDELNENKIITVKVKDTVFTTLDHKQYLRFKDSIINQTRDSLFAEGDDVVVLKHFKQGYSSVWQPSAYLFTDRTGGIVLKLPFAKTKKYKLVIYDPYGKELYYIKHIEETESTFDKGVFMRSGWYSFDLYEDDRLKEHNKFYLSPEF